MPHVALTTTEQAVLTTPTQVKGYLNYWKPTALATALINYAPGSVPAPITDVPVDTVSDVGVWTALPAGTTVSITDNTGRLHYYRLRQPPTATHLYIMETSDMDAGLMPDYDLANPQIFLNNNLITAYERLDFWSAIPYLEYTGGALVYKEDYFTQAEYIAQFGTSPNTDPWPQINLGPHVSKFVDPALGYFEHTFVASVENWYLVGRYSDYLWTIPAAWTLIGGSLTSNTITVRIPPGQYRVECSLGLLAHANPDSAWRYVWANERTGANAPIPVAEITSDTSDQTGRRMSFVVNDDLLSNFLDGSICNYFEENTYTGLPGGTTALAPTPTSDSVLGNLSGTNYEWAMGVRVPAGQLSQLTFTLGANSGAPSGTLTWKVCADNAGLPGTVLATGTLTPTPSAVNTVTVAGGPVFQVPTWVWLYLKPTAAQTAGNYWRWRTGADAAYTTGAGQHSTDGGASWTSHASLVLVCSLTTAALNTVPSAVNQCTGWLMRLDSDAANGLRTGSMELVGPAELLSRLGGYSATFTRSNNPLDFSLLNGNWCTVDFLIYYLKRMRAPMVTLLFDHHPFVAPPSALYSFAAYDVQPGTLLEQLQTLAGAMGCNYGHDSTGAAYVAIHPSKLFGARPGSVVARDTLTEALIERVQITREMRPRVRSILAFGYEYSGGVDAPVSFQSPSASGVMTPGQGTQDMQLDGFTRSGSGTTFLDWAGVVSGAYSLENNPIPDVSIDIPYNRDVYEPCQFYYVRLTLAAPYNAEGVAFDRYLIVKSVSRQYADGTKSLTLTCEADTYPAYPN